MKSEHQSNTSLQVLGLNEAQSRAELEAGKECRNGRTVSKKIWGYAPVAENLKEWGAGIGRR